eukprot:gnl/Spiro4/24055_TR11922_c0_g1_i1.p1 gnl/Spiro4/24055_TR11922_c0_g1~~gnl/Spiro4/24055_TR11922_c0_g1_i1.p1  ORF type:complete len:786 (+),score=192.81 gnl/Spiro4/24055_TR11922_c0_g1_i1:51-2408(+)
MPKPFKSRHATKSSLSCRRKGKVEKKQPTNPSKLSVSASAANLKAQRINEARVSRIRSRELLNAERRAHGGTDGSPRLVMFLSLGAQIDARGMRDSVLMHMGASPELCVDGPVTLLAERYKTRFTLFDAPRDLLGILDAAKVADIVVFGMPVTGADAMGETAHRLLCAQGLPTCCAVLMGLSEMAPKVAKDLRKQTTKEMETGFTAECKVFCCDTDQQLDKFCRHISQVRLKGLAWRSSVPHMLVERFTIVPADETGMVGTLRVTGYLRGENMSADQLAHITGYGNFQIRQIDYEADPVPARARHSQMEAEPAAVVAHVPNPETQMSLEGLREIDTALNEQTWPTEEELLEAERLRRTRRRRVPEGTSEYQAAWLEGVPGCYDDDNIDASDSDDNSDTELKRAQARGAAAATNPHGNTCCDHDDDNSGDDEGDESEGEAQAMELDEMMTQQQRIEERRLLLAQYRAQQAEDEEFPDEMQTPDDMPARIRFAKYRGLRSFRTSPWNPNENLPLHYGRLWRYQNFRQIQKDVLCETSRYPVLEGKFITIHIDNVPTSPFVSWNPTHPMVVSALRTHEQKISVLHFNVQRYPEFSMPIKSKDAMEVHCGFRRYVQYPIYSEYSRNCDKLKMERFFVHSRFSVASFCGPTTYSPAPIILFTLPTNEVAPRKLVATGSLMCVDPNMIICKKVLLSGHPLRIKRRRAIVRFMFFNPDDVAWFQKVELRTKWGRTGHITQSVGTHGYMKCQFDDTLKNQDTVMMALYKRVFPKLEPSNRPKRSERLQLPLAS